MAKANKLIDVAEAGAAATATSRPVIVGHGTTIAHDPMVTKDPEAESEKKLAPKAVTIEPPKPEVEPAVEAETVEQPESDSGVVDSLMNEVDAKQADKKQKKELEQVTAEIEKSIESKEFFVPIGLVSRRRSHIRVVIFLILFVVLAVAGLNFGVDAEVIDIGVQAFTDIL